MRKKKLQINLLGKPEMWLGGVLITNFSTAKTEALLYYLATATQIHSSGWASTLNDVVLWHFQRVNRDKDAISGRRCANRSGNCEHIILCRW